MQVQAAAIHKALAKNKQDITPFIIVYFTRADVHSGCLVVPSKKLRDQATTWGSGGKPS